MGSGSFKLAMVSLAAALAMPLSAIAQTGGAQPATNGTPQVEQPDSGGVNWKGAGVGAATLLANVGYIPAKTVYAIVGRRFALPRPDARAANALAVYGR
jgi:hypothetical protein